MQKWIHFAVKRFSKILFTEFDLFLSEKVKGNENMLRNSLDLVNITKKELQDDLRSLKSYRKHSCQTIPDGKKFIYLFFFFFILEKMG